MCSISCTKRKGKRRERLWLPNLSYTLSLPLSHVSCINWDTCMICLLLQVKLIASKSLTVSPKDLPSNFLQTASLEYQHHVLCTLFSPVSTFRTFSSNSYSAAGFWIHSEGSSWATEDRKHPCSIWRRQRSHRDSWCTSKAVWFIDGSIWFFPRQQCDSIKAHPIKWGTVISQVIPHCSQK